MSWLESSKRFAVVLWAAPTSAVALPLLLANAVSGGRTRVVQGVVESHGPAVRFFLRRCTLLKGGAAAMTLGHVVVGYDEMTLIRTRAHERVHVRQAERWGPLFLPAYVAASVLAWAKGENLYTGNAFEREAYGESDGGPPAESENPDTAAPG